MFSSSGQNSNEIVHRGSPLSQYVLDNLLNLALACNQEYCFITESDNQVIIINIGSKHRHCLNEIVVFSLY